jgi:hypothetical protein
LGEYEEALEWGEITSRNFTGPVFGGYNEFQTARHTGASHALLGNEQKALETIVRFESRMPTMLPHWMEQAWGLHKADILFCLGYERDALIAAAEAIGQPCPTLHDWGFAGAFARWVALTSKGSHYEGTGRLRLECLARDFEKLDALDQVEVLCALLLLGGGDPNPELQDIERNVHDRLTRLPHAIAQQLSCLGVTL